jgi:hypothetical protein
MVQVSGVLDDDVILAFADIRCPLKIVAHADSEHERAPQVFFFS